MVGVLRLAAAWRAARRGARSEWFQKTLKVDWRRAELLCPSQPRHLPTALPPTLKELGMGPQRKAVSLVPYGPTSGRAQGAPHPLQDGGEKAGGYLREGWPKESTRLALLLQPILTQGVVLMGPPLVLFLGWLRELSYGLGRRLCWTTVRRRLVARIPPRLHVATKTKPLEEDLNDAPTPGKCPWAVPERQRLARRLLRPRGRPRNEKKVEEENGAKFSDDVIRSSPSREGAGAGFGRGGRGRREGLRTHAGGQGGPGDLGDAGDAGGAGEQ